MTESYWNIPEVIIRTPADVLNEQAANLTNATKGVLVGEVKGEKSSSNTPEIALYIIVPALNSYKYKILDYEQQNVLVYPGKIYDYYDNVYTQVQDEAAFRAQVKLILSSEETSNILASLIAQARAAT